MSGSLAKWFKCNAIRYFQINVDILKIGRNGAAWLCQGDLDSSFSSSYNTWYRKLCLVDRWSNNRTDYSIGIYQGQSGFNREISRNEETKIPEATSRRGFFINEVKNHYTVLNREVYEPLSGLGLNPIANPYEYPSWKSRLKVNGYIGDDFLTTMAIQHLSADMPDLLNEIIEYRNRLEFHIKNVESLPRIVDSIVKSKFIESGIYPTHIDNYKKEGYYHFGDIDHLLNVDMCEGFLCGNRDIQSFVRNFNFLGREFTNKGDILYLGGLVIGRGNAEQRRNMERVIKELPKDRLILNSFNDLMNNKIELENKASHIRNMAAPMTKSIANKEYRGLFSCCPTQDETIWDFR
ncbi:MAG: hypothetical protein WBF33_29935 [Candidatus Nitrosopolaris sp.]